MTRFCLRAHPLVIGRSRDTLKLEYGGFNLTLKQSFGPPYSPFRDSEAQRQVFENFVQTHRDAILNSLRSKFVEAFEQGSPIDDYVRLRDLPSLIPDPDWLDTVAIPDELQMMEQIDAWLKAVEAPTLRIDPLTPFLPVTELREDNTRRIDVIEKQAIPLRHAWLRKHDLRPLGMLDTGPQRLSVQAGNLGLLDFRLLEEVDILRWMQADRDMAANDAAYARCQRTQTSAFDLNREAIIAKELKEARDRGGRTLLLDGQALSADQSDFRNLIDNVLGSITPDFLSIKPRFAALDEFSPGMRAWGGGSRRVGNSGQITRPTDTQKVAIGLVGEVIAYRWLMAAYPGLTDECWCSTYRDHFLGGSAGNDNLGYDFRIHSSRGEIFFEVKASSGDVSEVELGSSEVARRTEMRKTTASESCSPEMHSTA